MEVTYSNQRGDNIGFILTNGIKTAYRVFSKDLKANAKWMVEDECNKWGDTYLLSGEGT
ncbi:hypothetical protein ACSAZL_13375 [Methanosarcina sp. T3]|uniref:hypothetical protein n=1 Tax=Methanosarcina sp. T3 TaxID=3439062 RepID=UPI003F849EED